MGFIKYIIFEDINFDFVVVKKLWDLYDLFDFVEMYFGLVIEKVKFFIFFGSGFCINYIMSKVILFDVVSFICGDRFYILDYMFKNFINWG